jgi:uncharacterized protein (DUF362 family)
MDKPVVALIKNQTPPDAARIAEMLDEAMDLLGGMDRIVHPGDYVVIKGNFFAPYPPPVSVDRRVAAALIRAVRRAGASRVVLCEAVSIGTRLGRGTTTAAIMDELGVREAAEEAGAEVLCLEDDRRIRLEVPNARSIGWVDYPKCMWDCNVLIDLPCMKTHTMTMVTLGIKNFQGILSDGQKYYAHRDDLEQKLVDLQKIRRPDLTVIDGLIAMEGDGAGEQGTPRPMNLLIASRDIVAADSTAASCMGIDDVLDVTAIRLAQHDGIGIADPDKITVLGAAVADVREKFRLPRFYAKPQDRYLTGLYSNLDIHIGGACRQCWLMATGFASALSKYAPRRFTLFTGSDPKLPGTFEGDLDGVLFLGDCACGTAGPLKEIRNRMLLEGKGLIAPGCPPYRPASAMLEAYLDKRGLLPREQMKARAEAVTKKAYEYYKSIDPTWNPTRKPKSEG